MPRSELAVEASVTLLRSGEPGSVTVTATVLKSAAAAKALPGDLRGAVKSAPDAVTPAPRTSRTSASERERAPHAGACVRAASGLAELAPQREQRGQGDQQRREAR